MKAYIPKDVQELTKQRAHCIGYYRRCLSQMYQGDFTLPRGLSSASFRNVVLELEAILDFLTSDQDSESPYISQYISLMYLKLTHKPLKAFECEQRQMGLIAYTNDEFKIEAFTQIVIKKEDNKKQRYAITQSGKEVNLNGAEAMVEKKKFSENEHTGQLVKGIPEDWEMQLRKLARFGVMTSGTSSTEQGNNVHVVNFTNA